jgi:hypothetical protein
LDSNTKHPKVLLWYDFVKGVTDEEEDVLLVVEPYLFAIGTITLLELKILVTVVVDAKICIDAKIGTNEPIFELPHTLGEILVDITLARIKV